uniref:Uncharacterized protein n=1 Tax=Phenylobacterium glaciei TaxID=2803784 RepID=A0A974S8P5_9CAUL|nr:hypothetical protein JKL49_03890 [Phenylobacterium glaciei]
MILTLKNKLREWRHCAPPLVRDRAGRGGGQGFRHRRIGHRRLPYGALGKHSYDELRGIFGDEALDFDLDITPTPSSWSTWCRTTR